MPAPTAIASRACRTACPRRRHEDDQDRHRQEDRPRLHGEYPRMFCTKSEMKKKMPNIASATSSITMFAPVNVALRKSVRSSIGSALVSLEQDERDSAIAATANSARIAR